MARFLNGLGGSHHAESEYLRISSQRMLRFRAQKNACKCKPVFVVVPGSGPGRTGLTPGIRCI